LIGPGESDVEDIFANLITADSHNIHTPLQGRQDVLQAGPNEGGYFSGAGLSRGTGSVPASVEAAHDELAAAKVQDHALQLVAHPASQSNLANRTTAAMPNTKSVIPKAQTADQAR
jgi:hypothetical protein